MNLSRELLPIANSISFAVLQLAHPIVVCWEVLPEDVPVNFEYFGDVVAKSFFDFLLRRWRAERAGLLRRLPAGLGGFALWREN